MTRDTAKYRPLQRKKNKPHSLKWLARTHLELNIQSGEHEPVSILISTNSKKKKYSYIFNINYFRTKRMLMHEPHYCYIINLRKNGKLN